MTVDNHVCGLLALLSFVHRPAPSKASSSSHSHIYRCSQVRKEALALRTCGENVLFHFMIAGSLWRAVLLLAIARHCAVCAGFEDEVRRTFVSASHFEGCGSGRTRRAGGDGGAVVADVGVEAVMSAGGGAWLGAMDSALRSRTEVRLRQNINKL